MPLIDVSIAKGRSAEQLRALVSALHTATVDAVGATDDNVTIVVREVERELWSRGNVTISERDADVAPEQSPKET